MFRCEIGGEVVGPRVATVKVVTKKRSREYTDGPIISAGWETVHEVSACKAHADEYNNAASTSD